MLIYDFLMAFFNPNVCVVSPKIRSFWKNLVLELLFPIRARSILPLLILADFVHEVGQNGFSSPNTHHELRNGIRSNI